MNRWLVVALIGMTSVLVSPAEPARASTTIVVTTTTDGGPGSLRAAIDTANAASDLVTIVLAAGAEYDLTVCAAAPEDAGGSGDLDLTSGFGVTISGNDAVIRQTCPDSRVLDHHGPGALELHHLTLTGGNSTNQTHQEWKGLGLRSAAGLTASHLTVTGNVGVDPTQRTGAAVYLSSAQSATLDLSSVSDNQATGIVDDSPDSAQDLVITRSHVDRNVGSGHDFWTTFPPRDAGGITVTHRRLDLGDSTVETNTSPTIPVPPTTWPPINCSCNSPTVGGVSVALSSSTKLYAARNVIRHNTGFYAGGLFGGVLDVSDSLIEQNWSGAGGGVHGIVSFQRNVIRDNVAPLGGSGLWASGSLTDSTVSGNSTRPVASTYSSGGPGGGVLVNGTLTIRRSTVTGNVAASGGGIAAGFDIDSDPVTLTVLDSTVAGNDAVGSTDGAVAPAGNELAIGTNTATPAISFTRSVIGQPGATAPGACSRNGVAVTSAGRNLTTDASCLSAPAPTDRVNGGDPRLGPLADNGGPTPTRLPLAGSPVVDRIPTTDAGCTSLDQRGVARPQGAGCDIGAVEARKGGYHPVDPHRVVDSRTGLGTTHAPLGPGEARDLPLADASLPTSHVAALVLNVTAVGPTAASHLTLWPTGQPLPEASNLNFPAGRTIANLVTVATTDNHQVSVRNNSGATDVVVDLQGWYDDGVADPTDPDHPTGPCPCGTGFTATSPIRVLDTRPATSTGGFTTPFGPGQTRTLPLAGTHGIPADATAVVINLTATDTTAWSHLVAFGTGSSAPGVSNLNWPTGDTIAGLAIVPLGTGGAIDVENNAGFADVVGDVAGWFRAGPSGARFTPTVPTRLLDTRLPSGGAAPVGPGQTRTVVHSALPGGAAAAVVTLTGIFPTAPTHLTAWPADESLPTASNLNLPGGTVRPNLATVALSPAGSFNLRNNAGRIDVAVDLAGYYS